MLKKLTEAFYIEKDNKEEFYRLMHSENAKRICPILLIVIAYLTYILLLSIVHDFDNPDFKGTMIIKSILILLFIISILLLKKYKDSHNIILLGMIIYGTALTGAILGATNSFLVQKLIPNITIFIIAIMLIAALVRMSFLGTAFVYGSVYIYFLVGFPYFQTNEDYLTWNTINASIAVTVGVVLTLMMLAHSIAQFNDHKEIQRQNMELYFLANHDNMTKLLNHQSIHRSIEEMKNNALENDRIISLAVIDIDNLKKVNDSYGHLYGDAMIIEVANVLKAHSRELDIIGRYGGDEFILILPDTSSEEAYDILLRIKEAVANIFINDIKITVSIGIAVLTENNANSLLEEADSRMYESKRNGKNLITL